MLRLGMMSEVLGLDRRGLWIQGSVVSRSIRRLKILA
jgi:hypothetical protein